ncbi:hypothetical protein FPV58_23975 [Mycolicibacterium porcinum]|uniref:hypothetical protein n=1 Tax=Mycolicibacterium porcinum TaxID=39693 RepID=UPI001192A2B5|nr:hypothetical protein [Mycolicibacterium porcinum]TVX96724.1 hypothetical protein FPV58_23975 [Mycolicibacterium porcinum]
MQLAARPYLAAGVSLIGAGAIAISPVAPPMPDITVPAISSAQVNLSAATDPIQAYIDLFTNVFTNVQDRIGDELADPAPILQQIVANQVASATSVGTALAAAAQSLGTALDPSNPAGLPAAYQAAFEMFLDGDITGAVATAWSATLISAFGLLPALTAVQNAVAQPFQNLAKVVSDPTIVFLPAVGLLVPIYSTLTAAANVGQEIVDAAKAGDPLGVVKAMISGPAVIGDAIINEGLLGSGGLVALLRNLREQIATDITPPAAITAAGALAAAPQAKATTVTLDVAPQKPAIAPAAAPTEAAPAENTQAENTPAAEDSTAADASANAGTPVVKESIKAEPGKTLSTKRSTSAKQVREGVQGAVKNVTDGLKKAAEGLSGKSSTKKSSGGSSSSGAGAGSHGGA